MHDRKLSSIVLVCFPTIVTGTNIAAQSGSADPRQRSADVRRGTTGGGVMAPNAAFDRLDTSRRGFLTNDDLQTLHGFDSACDKDGDGRITRGEFSPCWSVWNRNQSPGTTTQTTPRTTDSSATPGTMGAGSTPGTMESGSTPGMMGSGAGSPGITPGSSGATPGPTGSGTGSASESGSPSMPGASSGSSGTTGTGSGSGSRTDRGSIKGR